VEPTANSVRCAPVVGGGSPRALGSDQQFKGGEPVKDHFTAVLKNKGDWWIGWIAEVPGVNCQERSKEDLIETLRITLREALEFNRREALEAAGESYEEQGIAL
jgi:hypothetical protein